MKPTIQTPPSDLIRRYERKYLITEEQAALIADWVGTYCSRDPNAQDAPDGQYAIHSLYFDTPQLDFFKAKEARELDRFKPRVRFYGIREPDAVFLEVKRKVNGVVMKTRAHLAAAEWPDVLHDAAHPMAGRAGVDEFLGKVHGWAAAPVVHVRYRREPWVSLLDNYGRVTFDRQLECAHARGSDALRPVPEDWVSVDDPYWCNLPFSPVVLELKCEQLTPVWMVDLVRAFDLMETAFSKYCKSISRAVECVGSTGQRISARP